MGKHVAIFGAGFLVGVIGLFVYLATGDQKKADGSQKKDPSEAEQ